MNQVRIIFAKYLIKFSEFLPKVSWGLVLISAYIKGDTESKDFLRCIKRERSWYKANGDQTYLVDHELSSQSIVFDVGGYIGNSAASIYCKYGATIHIFEPVDEYASRLIKRFGGNRKIHIHNYGLGSKTEDLLIYVSEGATSTFGSRINFTDKKSIKIQSFTEVLNILKIDEVDLMAINIEGGEYDLLDHIIDNNLLSKIRCLQIQFHEIDEDSEVHRNNIRSHLKLSHQESFCFPFVWEDWVRLDD